MVEGARITLPVRLDGLRVAISAGAGGIGRVMADGFAAGGARVVVCDVDQAALTACPHPSLRADLGDMAQAAGFVDHAISTMGGLDVLVNNAGIAGPTAPVEDVTDAEVEQTLRVDLAAMFATCRRAVPALRAAGGGAIVNLSSAAGRFGFPLRSPYAAAKWGVVGLTKSLAMELGPDGIRVNAICPGLVEGDRIQRVLAAKAAMRNVTAAEMARQMTEHVSLRCFVTPHDIANMVLYLCSPFGRTISGQAIAVDGDTLRLG